MEEELLEHLGKVKYGYYRKSTAKDLLLIFMTGMCLDLGLQYTSTKKRC